VRTHLWLFWNWWFDSKSSQTWAKDHLRIATTCLQQPRFWGPILSFYNMMLPPNNDYLSTTATNFGSQVWSLYTGFDCSSIISKLRFFPRDKCVVERWANKECNGDDTLRVTTYFLCSAGSNKSYDKTKFTSLSLTHMHTHTHTHTHTYTHSNTHLSLVWGTDT